MEVQQGDSQLIYLFILSKFVQVAGTSKILPLEANLGIT
jgi:hypothetical protein